MFLSCPDALSQTLVYMWLGSVHARMASQDSKRFKPHPAYGICAPVAKKDEVARAVKSPPPKKTEEAQRPFGLDTKR